MMKRLGKTSPLLVPLFLAACGESSNDVNLMGPPGPAFSVVSTGACGALPSGLLSWWPADGDAADVQGGHDGILEYGVTFALGKFGQAFSFDGDDVGFRGSRVRISPTHPTSATFTIEAWVFIDLTVPQPAANYRTIYADDAFGFWLVEVPVFSDNFRINWWQDGTNRFVGNSNVGAGEWHHIALTYDGVTFTGYLDGLFDGHSSYLGAALPGASSTLGIGRHGGEPFKGLIDEVRIYDRALSAAEVQAVACATPEQQIESLLGTVVLMELQRGIEQALSGPLDAALASIASDRPSAVQQLGAFLNQVEAFRGTKLTDAEADALAAAAQAIIDAINNGGQ